MPAWLLFAWNNKIVRYACVGLVASVALWYVLRLYSNRVYDEGYRSGKIAGAEDLRKTKETEWKAKEEAIALASKNLDQAKYAVELGRKQLAEERAGISATLKNGLAAIQAQREGNYAKVVAVPDDDLWGAIRSVSGQLAAKH